MKIDHRMKKEGCTGGKKLEEHKSNNITFQKS